MSSNDEYDGVKLSAAKIIATKVPINIHKEIINLVETGYYLSISDFLREAIREQLKLYKISKLKDITYDDAKTEILSYFNQYNECYIDEIAINLNLDYDLVINIVKTLENTGRIEVISNQKDFDNVLIHDDFMKIHGEHALIESKDKNEEFIRLSSNQSDNSILKQKGAILNNSFILLSKKYKFIK